MHLKQEGETMTVPVYTDKVVLPAQAPKENEDLNV